MCDFSKFKFLDAMKQTLLLGKANETLIRLRAEDRVVWALKHLPSQIVLSSSFGMQSVVTLHLVVQKFCSIPIILIDTGYLFPETYRYIDQLTESMQLNLQVYSSLKSSAWQEARYGKLWEQGLEGINQYNYMNKIEPMNRALEQLRVGTWFAGLRRAQSFTRQQLQILYVQKGVFKLLPILDWKDSQILKYIEKYDLICHPLWGKGYVSLGDVHTTRKYKSGGSKEETRFFGLKRECGLHEENF